MANNTKTSTTQEFLDIFDISNDILMLKDGSTSMIITVNAMNFGLLAEQEQDSIIYTYAALLNSLNYPIQIVIQSHTKDATSYLDLLVEQEATAPPKKKKQIAQYRQFVTNLIKERNVVVSASALEMGLLPAQSLLPGGKATDISTVDKSLILDRAKTILEPRRDHIIGQFNRIGLMASQLSTQEIIRVFYTNYNPEAVEGQQLTDTQNYTTPIITTNLNRAIPNYQPAANSPASVQNPAQVPTPAPAPVQEQLVTQPPLQQPTPLVQEQPVMQQPQIALEPTLEQTHPIIQETAPIADFSEPITSLDTPENPVTSSILNNTPTTNVASDELDPQKVIEDSLSLISEQPPAQPISKPPAEDSLPPLPEI